MTICLPTLGSFLSFFPVTVHTSIHALTQAGAGKSSTSHAQPYPLTSLLCPLPGYPPFLGPMAESLLGPHLPRLFPAHPELVHFLGPFYGDALVTPAAATCLQVGGRLVWLILYSFSLTMHPSLLINLLILSAGSIIASTYSFF